MKTLAIAILALASCLSYAQTAKVIALSPEEAAARAALAQQQKDIQAKIEDFDQKITAKYTYVKEAALSAGHISPYVTVRRGWESGITYSEDFRYIVSAAAYTPVPYIYNPIGITGTTTGGAYVSDGLGVNHLPLKHPCPYPNPLRCPRSRHQAGGAEMNRMYTRDMDEQ